MRHRLIFFVCLGLLMAACTFLPAYAEEDSGQQVAGASYTFSEEGSDVLESIANGNLDNMEIGEPVTLDEAALVEDFSGVVQEALDEAKSNAEQNPGTLTRIVIPDGVYNPHGRALQIYSNTILDLRGSGADTADPSDDYNYDNDGNPVGKVVIYQSDMSRLGTIDPPSLRCGDQDDGSNGYVFYQNMTVLGGTFIGQDKNGTSRGNACNVRFGHASNIKVIGTQITENQGGHHLEIGACKKVLVADCLFRGFHDGDKEDNSNGLSLEAIQLDVSHREKNNFAYYGEHDDLPVVDATITDCTFQDVRRGVGSHHAVFAHPYEKITVKNNTFRDIADKAIYFVYTKNAEIYNNQIEDAVCGIAFQYLVPSQHFQPNDGKGKVTAPEDFPSASKIYDNTIRLDDTKGLDSELTDAKAKYGIRVGGENVTAASGKTNGITAGTYYLCGVTVRNNDIGVSKGSKDGGIRAGVLADYAASCAVNNNTIDLKGYNEGSGESHAGILVSRSPNTGVASNIVKGVTNGDKTDGILVTSCGGKKSVTVTENKVYSPKRYGIHCYAVTNTGLSVYKNTISGAGAAGVKVTKSKMHNVTTNTVTGKAMTEPGISITDSTTSLVNSNKISGTKQHGLFLSASTAYKVNNNTITKPGANGLMLYNGSKASYVWNNIIDTPTKNGITVYNKSNVVYSIYGNTVKNAKVNGVLVGDDAKVTPRSKAFLIQANTLTSCKARGVSNGGWVNGIVANKVSKCGSSNKPYIKKGLTLCKYQVTVKKGKTCKITYYKSYATKSKVYWSTSNKKVATVNKYGTVKGIKKGTAYIYAKRDGVKVKAKVTVK